MRTSMTTLRGRRLGAVAAVAGLALLALTACSAGSSATSGTAGSATSGDITWWGWTPDKANAEKLIAAFTKEYPNIKVEFVSKPIDSYDSVLSPAITSSEGPDVFNVAPGSANGGVQTFEAGAVDLTSAVEGALGADWKTKLAPAGVDGLSVDNKLVGLSAGAVYSGGLWINQDLFDKYNLTPPTTLAEWKDVCATLTANGLGCFVQGAGQWAFDMDTFEAIADNVEPGLYVKASKGEVPWTDPRFATAMGLWKSLFDDGIMQEGAVGLQQYPDANNAFMAGKYAMVMMGTWYTQYAVKDSMVAAMEAAGVGSPTPITLTPIPFPDLAGTGSTGSMFGDADYGLAVSARSTQQAAATTFALWLTTSEAGQQAVANTLNDIPALKGVTPQWDQIDLVNPDKQKAALQSYTEAAGAATEPRFATVSADLNTAFRDALIGVASGDKTVTQALEGLDAVQTAQK
ncbi:carbohydrate ABC transporter substrate-binding protein (plasmid) [Cellulomonas sp. WB94]|uniref:ABC transporter substrate-binding protein n=1 Tax=Cellulomonas sp. WB94 TaxID=2173174 RepID=UPI000D579C08|nr:extracellular solute-binding protein [Cellulomonas sp. WB94]PVU84351.1 carbohydrate ABC transporter substrate-binding protein [Cellulomonas sp. WB94]